MEAWNDKTHYMSDGGAPAVGLKARPTKASSGDEPHDYSIGDLAHEVKRLADGLEELKEMIKGKSKEFYTVAEVATLTSRSEYTVRRWISSGTIAAERVTGTGPKGRLLIPRSEIARIVEMGNGHAVSGTMVAASAD